MTQVEAVSHSVRATFSATDLTAGAAAPSECDLLLRQSQGLRWDRGGERAGARAVAAAYGWPEDISTEDALARLLALNLERAKAQ